MDWLNRYRLREFVRSSFWVLPTTGLICAIPVARFLRSIDETFQWKCLDLTPEGAKAVLAAFVASMLTFVVVVASSLLLVVQMVSAGLTPRIIAPTFRNPLIRAALTLFVMTYALSVAVLGRIDEHVPQLAVGVAIVMNIASVILFLYFVGAIGMRLRPAEVMPAVAKKAREVIFEVYPSAYDPADLRCEDSLPTNQLGAPSSVIEFDGSSGVLLAFDSAGLVALARQQQVVIELVPRVGDYVAIGEPLFRIYGTNSVDPARLRRTVVLGAERTLEQDPRFAFRIIVDIACKALSPAINDPTTGVLAVDQIHRLLRWVGNRKLLTGTQADASGTVRLIYSTPNWEDFIWLGTTEIRHYGGDSIRICQRLRAMFEHLIQILPEARRPPLEEHLRLLNQTIERNFVEPADQNRIRLGASQRNGAATDA